MKYKFLEHTSDAKFQAFGTTLEQAFSNAALALASIMLNPKTIKPKIKKELKVKGIDEKSLLYNFLEEILFLLDTEQFLLNKNKKIEIKNNELKATLTGDKAENYQIEGAVKAITYNDMEIKKQNNKYMVQVVVDL